MPWKKIWWGVGVVVGLVVIGIIAWEIFFRENSPNTTPMSTKTVTTTPTNAATGEWQQPFMPPVKQMINAEPPKPIASLKRNKLNEAPVTNPCGSQALNDDDGWHLYRWYKLRYGDNQWIGPVLPPVKAFKLHIEPEDASVYFRNRNEQVWEEGGPNDQHFPSLGGWPWQVKAGRVEGSKPDFITLWIYEKD